MVKSQVMRLDGRVCIRVKIIIIIIVIIIVIVIFILKISLLSFDIYNLFL